MAETTSKAQYWGYTLNNHTEAEMIVIHDPPAGVGIIHHVWTPEQGESGTPHIQGLVKLRQQVRKSHLIRHWLPRASFRPLVNAEYRANMLRYVQKQDETARAATTQATNATPQVFPAMMPELIIRWIAENTQAHYEDQADPHPWRRWIRDTPSVAEDFDQWVERQDQPDLRHHHTEGSWTWKHREFVPSHEAPWELLIQYAKSQLVRSHRVETLVERPDVDRALARYGTEILWRIEHNDALQETRSEAEADSQAEAPVPETDPPSREGERA